MAVEEAGPRFRSPRDVALLVRALPLAGRAQRVRSQPLDEVVAGMGSSGGRLREPRRALVAAARASSRYARWFGGLDTCLTRSLVAGALLACGRDVVLHVGFRPASDEAPVDGHAWLTVDGERLDVDPPGRGDRWYAEVLEIPFRPQTEEGS